MYVSLVKPSGGEFVKGIHGMDPPNENGQFSARI
jgi:hypothetical protein